MALSPYYKKNRKQIIYEIYKEQKNENIFSFLDFSRGLTHFGFT